MTAQHLKGIEHFKRDFNQIFRLIKADYKKLQYVEYRRYSFFDCGGNFIGYYYLVYKETVKLKELTQLDSYLTFDCDLDIAKNILYSGDRLKDTDPEGKITPETVYYKLLFSKDKPVRYYD